MSPSRLFVQSLSYFSRVRPNCSIRTQIVLELLSDDLPIDIHLRYPIPVERSRRHFVSAGRKRESCFSRSARRHHVEGCDGRAKISMNRSLFFPHAEGARGLVYTSLQRLSGELQWLGTVRSARMVLPTPPERASRTESAFTCIARSWLSGIVALALPPSALGLVRTKALQSPHSQPPHFSTPANRMRISPL